VRRLASDSVSRQDHQSDGVGMDSTASRPKAEVADVHKAIGQAMLEEAPDKLRGFEVGGSWACTSWFTVGEGHGAVLERDDAAVGDSDFKDLGARSLKAVWPCGLAWLGPFGCVRPCH
jgi:hypothetical protein